MSMCYVLPNNVNQNKIGHCKTALPSTNFAGSKLYAGTYGVNTCIEMASVQLKHCATMRHRGA